VKQLRVRRGDVVLHVERWPSRRDATPLMLTHGFSSSSQMWADNVEPLATGRPVVTWDIRGHGRTSAPHVKGQFTPEACVADMESILDELEFDQAVIAGMSLGGYLSLAFHLAHPDRVAALVLIDTGPGYRSDDARERWNRFAESRAGAFESRGEEALPDSPEIGDGPHDVVGLALAARGIMAQRDDAVISSLSSIAVPTLVIVGADDEPFIAGSEYMASHIPGAKLEVIPDAGHAANIDQVDEFNRVVGEFLDGIG
jgi:pimeloyl-ACP methyl ester carboxylesterase